MADSQITGVFCGRCGLAVPDNRDPCRDCGSTSRRYDVSLSEQLDLEATLDLVHDSPASETKPHTIGSFKGYGLQSVASLDKHGVVRLRVQGLPDVGTRGEPDVMNLLQAALKADGSPLQLAPGALDSRGEDGLLVSGKQRFSLQVTAVPQANSFWRDAARGSGSTEVSKEMAVEWIREAVMKKALVGDRKNTILAIDARHAGVLSDTQIAGLYRSTYSSPTEELGFAGAWIVGPTSSNCTRL